MIIVDTSVWIDHIRRSLPTLGDLLLADEVRQHPFVTGEIMLGSIASRERVIAALSRLPAFTLAPSDALLDFVRSAKLSGTGIGFVDAHLLLSAKIDGAQLWTFDKRLAAQAERLGLSY